MTARFSDGQQMLIGHLNGEMKKKKKKNNYVFQKALMPPSSSSRMKEFGDWSEQTSSSGKRYFYNRLTEVSQWEKPLDWAEYERGLLDASSSFPRSPRSANSSSHHVHMSSRPSTSAALPTAIGEIGVELTPLTRSSPNDRRRDDGRLLQADVVEPSLLLRGKNCADGKIKRERAADSPDEDVAKRRRLHDSNSVLPPAAINASSGNPSVPENGVANRPAMDLSKLPDLLVRVAERLGINMKEQRALEQLQRTLTTATRSALNSDQRDMKFASTPVATTTPTIAAVCTAQQPLPPPRPPDVCSESPACSSTESVPQQVEVQLQSQETPPICREESPPLPPPTPSLSSDHVRFYRPTLGAHAAGWAAEHFEAQAWVHAASALEQSLRLGDNSADLKCARSLVRTAEIRSTLLRQKLLFVSQQQRQLAAAASGSRAPPSSHS